MKRILFLFSIFQLWAFKVYACPMCSDIISRGKDAIKTLRFGEGIAWSIALFFSMPLLLIGGMVFMIYRSTKKQREHQESTIEK